MTAPRPRAQDVDRHVGAGVRGAHGIEATIRDLSICPDPGERPGVLVTVTLTVYVPDDAALDAVMRLAGAVARAKRFDTSGEPV